MVGFGQNREAGLCSAAVMSRAGRLSRVWGLSTDTLVWVLFSSRTLHCSSWPLEMPPSPVLPKQEARAVSSQKARASRDSSCILPRNLKRETSLCNRQEELPGYKSQLVFESGTEGKLWINEFELRNKQSVHKDDLPLGAGTLRFPAVSLTSCQKRLKCQSFVRNSEVRT